MECKVPNFLKFQHFISPGISCTSKNNASCTAVSKHRTVSPKPQTSAFHIWTFSLERLALTIWWSFQPLKTVTSPSAHITTTTIPLKKHYYICNHLQPISTLSDKTQGHHHYRPRYCGYILLSLLSMSNVRRPRPSPNSHPLFTHSNGPLNFRVLCNHIS